MNTEESKTKRFFRYLGIVAFVLAAVMCGKIVGDMIVGSTTKSPDYASFDETTLIDDEDAIWQSFLNKEISFNKLTANDANKAIVIATRLCNQKDYFFVNSTGTVTASVATQTLCGSYEKDGNQRISTEISNGLKKVANKMMFNEATKTVTLYKGKVASDGKSGIFTSSPKQYTEQLYKTECGASPYAFYNHIISSKTILSSSIKNTQSGKQFTVVLDPVKAVINYAKQISVNSDMDEPTFKNIKFSFEIDKDFNFVSYEVEEEYVVNYGISVTCSSKINSVFSYTKGV